MIGPECALRVRGPSGHRGVDRFLPDEGVVMEDQAQLAAGDVVADDPRLGRPREDAAAGALEVGPDVERDRCVGGADGSPVGQGDRGRIGRRRQPERLR